MMIQPLCLSKQLLALIRLFLIAQSLETKVLFNISFLILQRLNWLSPLLSALEMIKIVEKTSPILPLALIKLSKFMLSWHVHQ